METLNSVIHIRYIYPFLCLELLTAANRAPARIRPRPGRAHSRARSGLRARWQWWSVRPVSSTPPRRGRIPGADQCPGSAGSLRPRAS